MTEGGADPAGHPVSGREHGYIVTFYAGAVLLFEEWAPLSACQRTLLRPRAIDTADKEKTRQIRDRAFVK